MSDVKHQDLLLRQVALIRLLFRIDIAEPCSTTPNRFGDLEGVIVLGQEQGKPGPITSYLPHLLTKDIEVDIRSHEQHVSDLRANLTGTYRSRSQCLHCEQTPH